MTSNTMMISNLIQKTVILNCMKSLLLLYFVHHKTYLFPGLKVLLHLMVLTVQHSDVQNKWNISSVTACLGIFPFHWRDNMLQKIQL
jgi:hypothetical protein